MISTLPRILILVERLQMLENHFTIQLGKQEVTSLSYKTQDQVALLSFSPLPSNTCPWARAYLGLVRRKVGVHASEALGSE